MAIIIMEGIAMNEMLKFCKLILLLIIIAFGQTGFASESQFDGKSFIGVCQTFDETADHDELKLTGYKIYYPENFINGYKLLQKTIGVTLSVPVTNEEFSEWETLLAKAVYDEKAFTELSKYNPFRQSGAVYVLDEDFANPLIIATMPTKYYKLVEIPLGRVNNDLVQYDNFIIDGYNSCWITYTDKSISPMLTIDCNGITIMIFGIGNLRPERSEAIKMFNDMCSFTGTPVQ